MSSVCCGASAIRACPDTSTGHECVRAVLNDANTEASCRQGSTGPREKSGHVRLPRGPRVPRWSRFSGIWPTTTADRGTEGCLQAGDGGEPRPPAAPQAATAARSATDSATEKEADASANREPPGPSPPRQTAPTDRSSSQALSLPSKPSASDPIPSAHQPGNAFSAGSATPHGANAPKTRQDGGR